MSLHECTTIVLTGVIAPPFSGFRTLDEAPAQAASGALLSDAAAPTLRSTGADREFAAIRGGWMLDASLLDLPCRTFDPVGTDPSFRQPSSARDSAPLDGFDSLPHELGNDAPADLADFKSDADDVQGHLLSSDWFRRVVEVV